jgi:hypothetical protein
MLKRIIKPQIIKRFCHHSSETNYSRMLDKLNNIEKTSNFTSGKMSKLEKDINQIEKVLAYNYVFTVIIIPTILLVTA